MSNVITIGTSCSPSKIIKTFEMYGHRVTMSCGGGVGGNRWTEYITDFPYSDVVPNKLIRCHNYKGESVMLNTNFIVKCEPINIACVVEDITDWVYYGKPKMTTEYATTFFACNLNDRVNFVNTFTYHKQIPYVTIIEEIRTKDRFSV